MNIYTITLLFVEHKMEQVRNEVERPLIMHYNGAPMVLFYGHKDGKAGRQFSNFYPCELEVDTNTFRGNADLGVFNGRVVLTSSEQYLMLRKAICFDDAAAAVKIINSPSPARAKALGRGVKNYDDKVWACVRLGVMVDGLMIKFAKDPLKQYLLDTGDATIVECAPNDKIWGIGLKVGDLEAFQRDKWQGQNLLGEALMEVRRRLRM
jgi:ribA/ribD-fused uncharacterized protein